MPIHDWTRVDEGVFRHFHLLWTCEICKRLNRGILPQRYYAIAEQGVCNKFTAMQRSIAIRHTSKHGMVALMLILTPENKVSEYEFGLLLGRIEGTLNNQAHVFLIDLQPPTPRDPHGIHAAAWAKLRPGTISLPEADPLTLVSYAAGLSPESYVQPVAVGQLLPDMPLFLAQDRYVTVPLESTYLDAWEGVPDFIQAILTQGSPEG